MIKVKENEILWAKVSPNAIVPTKKNENAGYDIYACFNEDYICIETGETKLIPTGLACALNKKHYLQLEERGSTGTKGMKRSAGVIDSGYRGEIFVALTNSSNKTIIISKKTKDKLYKESKTNIFNDKVIKIKGKTIYLTLHGQESVEIYPYEKAICQGIVHIVPELQSREVDYEELLKYESDRGDGKLGSSGK